jgi:hypothetical protein
MSISGVKFSKGHDETLDLSDPRQRAIHETEMSIAMMAAEILQTYYPGHRFEVTVDCKNPNPRYHGMMIRYPMFQPYRKPYIVPVRRFLSASVSERQRLLLNAGGEILERFDIPRSNVNFAEAHLLDARGRLLKNPNMGISG